MARFLEIWPLGAPEVGVWLCDSERCLHSPLGCSSPGLRALFRQTPPAQFLVLGSYKGALGGTGTAASVGKALMSLPWPRTGGLARTPPGSPLPLGSCASACLHWVRLRSLRGQTLRTQQEAECAWPWGARPWTPGSPWSSEAQVFLLRTCIETPGRAGARGCVRTPSHAGWG